MDCACSSQTGIVATAVSLAVTAHAGQVDKQGRDYFDHHLEPIATLLRPFGEMAEAAGYLHDILEDTPVTWDDLSAAGIPAPVISAVMRVTKGKHESYEAFIWSVSTDPLARMVKLADNWVNLMGLDGIEDEVTRERLRAKYTKARQVLGAY